MFLRTLALASSLSAIVGCPTSSAADADLILHHGRIITVDRQFSVQSALAVQGGRILRVGSDAEVLQAHTGFEIKISNQNQLPGDVAAAGSSIKRLIILSSAAPSTSLEPMLIKRTLPLRSIRGAEGLCW